MSSTSSLKPVAPKPVRAVRVEPTLSYFSAAILVVLLHYVTLTWGMGFDLGALSLALARFFGAFVSLEREWDCDHYYLVVVMEFVVFKLSVSGRYAEKAAPELPQRLELNV